MHLTAVFKSLPRRSKVLWVASPGGHLTEALRVEQLIGASSDSLWVTSETPQTVSALKDRRTHFVGYVSPRDLRASARAARSVADVLARERFDACISTGAAIAGLSVPLAAHRGVRSYYVESLARIDGPSVTGRLMRASLRVTTLTQHQSWTSRRWKHEGSVLDGWEARATSPAVKSGLNILVTLGTIRPYRFDRAVDAVLGAITPEDRVTWQLGSTFRNDLPGRVVRELSQTELEMEIELADVVVAHAGVGSVLLTHSKGKLPVLAIRSATYDEHVDEHQSQIGEELIRRGLGVRLELDSSAMNNRATLVHSAARKVFPSRGPVV